MGCRFRGTKTFSWMPKGMILEMGNAAGAGSKKENDGRVSLGRSKSELADPGGGQGGLGLKTQTTLVGGP